MNQTGAKERVMYCGSIISLAETCAGLSQEISRLRQIENLSSEDQRRLREMQESWRGYQQFYREVVTLQNLDTFQKSS
jgi:hypothetical protein